jgi:hypothetical protein
MLTFGVIEDDLKDSAEIPVCGIISDTDPQPILQFASGQFAIV